MIILNESVGNTLQFGDALVTIDRAHNGKVRLRVDGAGVVRRSGVLMAKLRLLGWREFLPGYYVHDRRGEHTLREALTIEGLI